MQGMSSCSTVQVICEGAPGEPTGPLTVSDITKNACRLTWKPPKVDGGSRITSYQIERQEVGKPYWVTVSSHCKVRGLLWGENDADEMIMMLLWMIILMILTKQLLVMRMIMMMM